MVLLYLFFLSEWQPWRVYVQPKTGIHLQRTIKSKVIITRVSWRECSRGYSSVQGTEGHFPHHCNPLNTEDAAQHQKGYCLLPLTVFPSVPFAGLEMLITSLAGKEVYFSWKKEKMSLLMYIFIYVHIFITCLKKPSLLPVYLWMGMLEWKPSQFPHLWKPPHTGVA